jgi:hypothetical protein
MRRSQAERIPPTMLASTAIALALVGAGPSVDNPWFPLPAGRHWTYREGNVRTVVTVTGRTRLMANGVVARIVHDESRERGVPVEITDDYYAQDAKGTVWYLGEATTAYEKGKPASTEGSWEAGVAGARPGVIMPAHPRVGMAYRQEYFKGHAEDRAKIVSRNERVKVPLRRYRHTLMTLETTPLEPDVLEAKFYARGVGVVLAVGLSGEADREVLTAMGGGRTTRG